MVIRVKPPAISVEPDIYPIPDMSPFCQFHAHLPLLISSMMMRMDRFSSSSFSILAACLFFFMASFIVEASAPGTLAHLALPCELIVNLSMINFIPFSLHSFLLLSLRHILCNISHLDRRFDHPCTRVVEQP